MNINVSLFFQIIVFSIFVWITMKYIWPPIMVAINTRQVNIADGLAAAEQGRKDAAQAKLEAQQIVAEAKTRAEALVLQAQQQAGHIVEHAKSDANVEYGKIVQNGNKILEQELLLAKRQLHSQVVSIALQGTEKLLQRNIEAKDSDKFLDNLLGSL